MCVTKREIKTETEAAGRGAVKVKVLETAHFLSALFPSLSGLDSPFVLPSHSSPPLSLFLCVVGCQTSRGDGELRNKGVGGKVSVKCECIPLPLSVCRR